MIHANLFRTMEIAVSTLFSLPIRFNDAINLIPKMGSKRIEIVDAGAHALSRSRVDALIELKEAHGLEYSVHASYTDVNLSSDEPEVREAILRRIEKSIEWTAELGGEVTVFHPGNSTALEWTYPGTAWDLNLKSVRRLVRHAEEHGVSAMIENVPEPFPYVMKSVEHFDRFFEEVGMEVKMVLDVPHAHLRGEPLEFIERHGDRISHVHVSDNHGESDDHLEIGMGSVDWEDVMEALKESPFDGWVTIESYHGIEESIEFLRRLM